MGKRLLLTEEVEQEIVRLFKEGALLKDIAGRVGLKASFVDTALRRLGIPPRRHFVTDHERGEIVRLWSEGLRSPAIMKQLGLGEAIVLRVLKKSGVKRTVGNNRFTEEQKDKMAQRYAAGETSADLANEYRTTKGVITRASKARGVRLRHDNSDVAPHEKRCARCQEVKSRTGAFHRSSSQRDGLFPYCKPCCIIYNQRYKPTQANEAKQRRLSLRKHIQQAYGGRCECCGETAEEFLTIDHVDGNGAAHRRELRKLRKTFYKWLRENGFPKENFRLLCYNCNIARGRFGICPHERDRQLALIQPIVLHPIQPF